MKELADIIALARAGDVPQVALATVVRIDGSSYRRPGASMLIGADGRRLGSVSGGCLERDVESHAKAVLASGQPRLVTYDTRDDADVIFGTALGCGGLVEVFIERIDLLDAHGPVQHWAAAADRRDTIAELTIVAAPPDARVSAGLRSWVTLDAPGDRGAQEPSPSPPRGEEAAHAERSRRAWGADDDTENAGHRTQSADGDTGNAGHGTQSADDGTRKGGHGTQSADDDTQTAGRGTESIDGETRNAGDGTRTSDDEALSGGAADAMANVIAAARDLMRVRRSGLVSYATASGEVRAFVRIIEPPVRLLICGAGDDAQPVAQMAGGLGWRVWVWDHRAGFAKPERFPGAERVEAIVAGTLPPNFAADPRTVAIVMNHHYPSDRAWLAALAPLPLPYLGLLGARHRTARLLRECDLPPVGPGGLEQLYAPAGLDIGAEGAESIALAMVAEMQAVLAGRRGGRLRDAARPIQAAGADVVGAV